MRCSPCIQLEIPKVSVEAMTQVCYMMGEKGYLCQWVEMSPGSTGVLVNVSILQGK